MRAFWLTNAAAHPAGVFHEVSMSRLTLPRGPRGSVTGRMPVTSSGGACRAGASRCCSALEALFTGLALEATGAGNVAHRHIRDERKNDVVAPDGTIVEGGAPPDAILNILTWWGSPGRPSVVQS